MLATVVVLFGCQGIFSDLGDQEFHGTDSDAGLNQVDPDADDPDADSGDPDASDLDSGAPDADTDDPDVDEDAPYLTFGTAPDPYILLDEPFVIEVELHDPDGGDWEDHLITLTVNDGEFSDGADEVEGLLQAHGAIHRVLFTNLRIDDEVEVTFTASGQGFTPITTDSVEVGCIRDGFEGGDGTEGDPYQICGSEQLARIGEHLEGETYFEITRSFDFPEYFEPIGSDSDPFLGHLYGGEHTLSGLRIDGGDESLQGLFAVVGDGAVIRDFTLRAPVVKGVDDVGVVAGRSRGLIQQISVINGEVYGADRVGGLVGEMTESAEIQESNFQGQVGDQTAGTSIGGLAGTSGGTIRTSTTNVTVEGNDRVGGLVGEMSDGSTVEYCESTGQVDGQGIVGGLVGSAQNYLADSTSSANVTGRTVGGLVGHSWADMNNLSATGNVTVLASGDVAAIGGGLVGSHNGDLQLGFASGNVTTTDVNAIMGGLVGMVGNGVYVTTSYATGNVSGGFQLGGLVGSSSGLIQQSYSEGSVSGGQLCGGLVGNVNDLPSGNEGNEVFQVFSNTQVTGCPGGMGGLVGRLRGTLDEAYNIGYVEPGNDSDALVASPLGGAEIPGYRVFWLGEQGATSEHGCCSDFPLSAENFSDTQTFQFSIVPPWEMREGLGVPVDHRPVFTWME